MRLRLVARRKPRLITAVLVLAIRVTIAVLVVVVAVLVVAVLVVAVLVVAVLVVAAVRILFPPIRTGLMRFTPPPMILGTRMELS
jgi:hypothetical protein